MSDNGLAERQNRYELRNRYVFRGLIVMQTALHIGGGKVTLSNSDSPIVLTPDQKPFIPGSSFKGALRSAVEKIVPGLPARAGFTSCALLDRSGDQLPLLPPLDKLHPPRWPDGACPTIWQTALSSLRQEYPRWDQDIVADAMVHLCSTCRLFGSPFAAARVNVGDLYIPIPSEEQPEEWSGFVQTRDGVSIDRDSEKARDRLKYDFEVAAASATFKLEITLENATRRDLQLLCVGLSEFVHGFGAIGGKRSRGLGVARLEELQVWELDLEVDDEAERNRRLAEFLISGRFSREELPGEAFLQDQIKSIFREGGA
jgi:CRISPR/Cas system CSM-associated protein Csm3 (group 7 of RAMP superfamily)